MLALSRVNDVTFLLNLNDVILRNSSHQAHQMVQGILARVLKPPRFFTQIVPNAQLHGVCKKRLGLKGGAFVWRHDTALQTQAPD
jgi:hypothetical protein